MNNPLHIGTADDGEAFRLPLDLVTQTVAILAKRRVGKSYTASVMAEELLKAGQQVVAIDPTGAWWGIRSSANGKSDGFPVVILGGDHADLPLSPDSGETVARWIVEKRFSAVLDVSLFRKSELRRFVTPFLETVYRLNREPMHLVVDEADDICPQKPFGDEAAMVGAMEDVVKRGGKKGIGCTLITQRPADLAKQVLTQCEMVVALRIVHPRDIKAVMEWINVHAEPAAAKAMIAELPSLKRGTAYFWSPGWGDIFSKVLVRERQTFDSGATPKAGQKIKEPSRLAPIDVQKLGEEIAATVEKAKAEDPKRLMAEITKLKQALAKAAEQTPAQVSTGSSKTVIDAAVAKALTEREAAWSRQLSGVIRRVHDFKNIVAKQAQYIASAAAAKEVLDRQLDEFAEALQKRTSIDAPTTNGQTASRPSTKHKMPAQSPRADRPVQLNGVDQPTLKILHALAWWRAVGVESPTVAQLAAIAGYAVSGTFNTYLGRATTNGLIRRERGCVALVDPSQAPEVDAPATLDELHARVMQTVDGPGAKIIQALIDKQGESMSVSELAEATGYAVSGTFNTYLGRLATRGFIERGGGRVAPSMVLYPETLR